ncbi:MAG: PIG-L family deacetylase [Desulfobacteraceae bacterium]|nr:PIG-L family deacetylase [Desulfobacteraceae bacterium]
MNKILVVGVHSDDETLGCGGTLLKHKSNGDEINWLLVTDAKKEDGYSSNAIDKSAIEIKKVAEAYSFKNIVNLKLSAAKLDQYSISELINKISNVINAIQPDIIYLPFKSDVHSDHRVIFEAAYSCTKSFRYPFIKKIYMMEVLSETEFAPSTKEDCFVPNTFVDISRFMKEKIDILKIYEDEIRNHPFPRNIKNIEALATLRGATCGCEFAESFVLLKSVE